jgi:hypothetical protein
LGIVDLFEKEIVACFDGTAVALVKKANDQAGDGEERHDPFVRLPKISGDVECDQENGGGGTCQDSDRKSD